MLLRGNVPKRSRNNLTEILRRVFETAQDDPDRRHPEARSAEGSTGQIASAPEAHPPLAETALMRLAKTNKKFIFLILFFAISGCSSAQSFKTTFGGERVDLLSQGNLSYAQHLPLPLPEASRKQPLYLLLHPGGSSGEEFLERWVPLLGRNESFMIAPTSEEKIPYGSGEFDHELWTLLEKAIQAYPIDQNRIFLIGESNGAIYGYQLIERYPDFFKAAVLASGSIEQNVATGLEEHANTVKTALLVVHGEDDAVFPISVVEKEIEKLKQAGLKLEFRAVKDMQHGSDAFADDDIVKWIQQFE